MGRFRGMRWWIAFGLVWLCAVGVGLGRLMRFASTPGSAAMAPSQWPTGLPLEPAKRGTTLVISVHPQCSCSNATLGELARLMAKAPTEDVKAYVLLVRPAGAPAGFERGSLADQASAIPGVTVLTDVDGAWSTRFGALTSGQTYAFASGGRLLFSGGITAARGHMGDNAGSDAIAVILSGSGQQRAGAGNVKTPVYGCSLHGPEGSVTATTSTGDAQQEIAR